MSLWRDHGQVVPRKEQYWCFLGCTPWIFTISMFYVRNPSKQWQIKINDDSGHFSGCPINIVVSFAEQLELWEKKRKINNQELGHFAHWKYFIQRKNKEKKWYLFAEHPKFKNKSVLNMEFEQLVSNENQQARFNKFFTLKMIYTGCSVKGAILLLFQ